MNKIVSLLCFVSLVSCGTFGIPKPQGQTDFCYISEGRLICYKNGVATVKEGSACSQMEGHAIITIQRFEELTNP